MASRSAARLRAAMPFVHLERELWDLRDSAGRPIGVGAPERRGWLLERGAVGRLQPAVERLLLGDLGVLAAAVRLLLEGHFTLVLAAQICSAVDLDVAAIEAAAVPGPVPTSGRGRRAGFAEEVLRAYAYQCAMCGFDGALGRDPVGLEAGHVRWRSHDGPDELANALALCVLHHGLLDRGALGLTPDLRIRVSGLYVARSPAGRAIDALAGQPLLPPRPGQPPVAPSHVEWHAREVFKTDAAAA